MAIPSIPLFEDFISKVRVLEQPTGSSVVFFTGLGRPTFHLEYPTTELPLDAVLRVISRELEERGCASNRDIAIATLGGVAATRGEATGAIEHANRCLSHIHSAELHQYFILPTPCRRDYEAVFGDFRIRAFDPQRVLYWSRRGGSSYPLDLEALSGRTTLERERFSTALVNWEELPLERRSEAYAEGEQLVGVLRDAYYTAVFEHYLAATPRELRRSALVLEAGALVHFDVESFMELILAERVGLFHWQSHGQHRTWAVLSSLRGLNLNLPDTALLGDCREWLKDVVGFTKLDLEKAFDRAVNMFCVLLQRAHDHRLNGRGDEAALHFVIALDALFGSVGRSTESVAARAAVITCVPFNRSLQDQIKQIKALYAARSKYVHEGCEMSADAVREAERVATEVLWALLAVSGAGTLSNTGQWITKIDYVAAALNDGRNVPDEEFTALGITRGADAPRRPPNRVLESQPEAMLDINAIRLPRQRRRS